MVAMKITLKFSFVTGLLSLVFGVACAQQVNPNQLPQCPKEQGAEFHNCWGTFTYPNGNKYVGEYKDGNEHGQGTYIFRNGDKYVGEFKNNSYHGQGTFTRANGDKHVGEYRNGHAYGQGMWMFTDGSKYVGDFKDNMQHGQGTYTYPDGSTYVGEWRYGEITGQGKRTFKSGGTYVGESKNGIPHGQGTYSSANGVTYVGELKDGKRHGKGIATSADGRRQEGIWESNKFIREESVNLADPGYRHAANNTDRSDIDRENQQLAEELRRPEQGRRQHQEQRRGQQLNLVVTTSQPASDGVFTITAQTNTDTASLLINGEEQGGRVNGDYIVTKIARAGQETRFTIVAMDVNGNTDTKTITVSRQVIESKVSYAPLNPTNIKRQPERDAVAVVIGIGDYRSLPKAEYANDDARAFYDYAIRALGVKPENIKLLVDSDAEDVEILKTFRTWLPSRVKSTTDVYVYYSGHGLPSTDGQSLYILPQRADRDLIEDTAIPFSKINAALQLAKPRSVTIFMDACYSGQARSGETLVRSARPISLRTENRLFPDSFTVITASQHDQISSSSPDLQHGIFSYYLMRGMEGDADANKDGKITLGEMQVYLSENVSRQAAMMSRKQEPQLIGDANWVLVGR
jgi:hypothetical protein